MSAVYFETPTGMALLTATNVVPADQPDRTGWPERDGYYLEVWSGTTRYYGGHYDELIPALLRARRIHGIAFVVTGYDPNE